MHTLLFLKYFAIFLSSSFFNVFTASSWSTTQIATATLNPSAREQQFRQLWLRAPMGWTWWPTGTSRIYIYFFLSVSSFPFSHFSSLPLLLVSSTSTSARRCLGIVGIPTPRRIFKHGRAMYVDNWFFFESWLFFITFILQLEASRSYWEQKYHMETGMPTSTNVWKCTRWVGLYLCRWLRFLRRHNIFLSFLFFLHFFLTSSSCIIVPSSFTSFAMPAPPGEGEGPAKGSGAGTVSRNIDAVEKTMVKSGLRRYVLY